MQLPVFGNTLDIEWLADHGQTPTAIFVHGIMGSKKNLMGFAKRFVTAFPHYRALLLDLPNHGASQKGATPFTVAACARDVAKCLEILEIGECVLVGHSFGAKVVALVALEASKVSQIWMLDSSPSPSPARALSGNKNALEIMDILQSLTWPKPDRKSLAEDLLRHGLDRQIAWWMTTNVHQGDHGFVLDFEVSQVREMLKNFLELDTWPALANIKSTTQVHLVRAGGASRVSSADGERLLGVHVNACFHTQNGVGHFLHSEDPEGLLEIMRPYF